MTEQPAAQPRPVPGRRVRDLDRARLRRDQLPRHGPAARLRQRTDEPGSRSSPAALVILGVRAVFAELNGMYPTAAGIRLWMTRAINDRLALIVTLTYMTAIVLVIAADAFIIGEAIAHAFNNGHAVAIVYVAALLVFATWMNLRGIKLAGAGREDRDHGRGARHGRDRRGRDRAPPARHRSPPPTAARRCRP